MNPSSAKKQQEALLRTALEAGAGSEGRKVAEADPELKPLLDLYGRMETEARGESETLDARRMQNLRRTFRKQRTVPGLRQRLLPVLVSAGICALLVTAFVFWPGRVYRSDRPATEPMIAETAPVEGETKGEDWMAWDADSAFQSRVASVRNRLADTRIYAGSGSAGTFPEALERLDERLQRAEAALNRSLL